jgi:Zn-dependent protease with chaperone function
MEMARSGRSFHRAGIAAVAMILVAEAGVWLLRPRPAPIAPAPVSATDYFTHAQIQRGADYSNGQLLLFAGGLVIEFAVMVPLALGRPRRLRDGLRALERRPVAGGAAAGAGLSIALALAALPTGIASHERAVDFGLSTQDLGSWLGDDAKAVAIGALLAGAGGALLIFLVRRFERRWWLPGTAAVVAYAAVSTWLAPVVIAPLFNKFEPLPESSPARAEVMGLGRKAGVDIGQVYRVDASRRVTSLNAYVDGVGSTKRVVLYDNLIDGTDRAELGSVVAHELGHVKHDDILRGLAFVALIAPLGVLFVAEAARAFAARAGVDPRSPRALPAYALALTMASLALGTAGNQLSRKVEASADTFALELTHDPGAFIKLQERLNTSNLGNPDPPDVSHWLFGTHPTALERIGAAVAYRNETR